MRCSCKAYWRAGVHFRFAACLFSVLSLPLTACRAETDEASPGVPPKIEILLEATAVPDDAAVRPAPDIGRSGRAEEREQMVEQQIAARGVLDPRVLEAMRTVPRHALVPSGKAKRAYGDYPLPIGHGQTISQPYIVALMTEMLRPEPNHKVLEVGTGSGYQAAVLAQVADQVVSIEIVEALAKRAARDLETMGYQNLTVLYGDGYFGYEANAPYDGIIVTAAAEHIPPPLIAQLKPGGRMIIPVGSTGWTQNLVLLEKSEDGNVTTRNILPVRFVPLTRERR